MACNVWSGVSLTERPLGRTNTRAEGALEEVAGFSGPLGVVQPALGGGGRERHGLPSFGSTHTAGMFPNQASSGGAW